MNTSWDEKARDFELNCPWGQCSSICKELVENKYKKRILVLDIFEY